MASELTDARIQELEATVAQLKQKLKKANHGTPESIQRLKDYDKAHPEKVLERKQRYNERNREAILERKRAEYQRKKALKLAQNGASDPPATP